MQKLLPQKDESGFTMVELMVVIGILALLMAIAIPVYLNQRKEAWKAAVRTDITNSVVVVERTKSLNGDYQNFAGPPPGASVSSGVSLKVTVLPATSGNTACVEAYHTASPTDTKFHYNIAERKLLSGGC